MKNRSDTRTRRAWLTLYAPVLLWVSVIFLMSSNLGSAPQTSRIIRPILEWLFPASSPETLDLYQWFIRKLAHLTEYGVLGGLALRMFRNVTAHWVVSTVAFVAVVATLDELHQSLVSSRTASPYDVPLDTAGGVLAVLAAWLYFRRYANR